MNIQPLLLSLLIGTPVIATAEIRLDGTLGSTEVLAGPDYQIPESVGRLMGDNLFHSFADFNIRAGESATFTGNAAIQRIINRVTGGNLSEINGLLKSDIFGADIYLLNPSGIFIGEDAELDITGSFSLSTAAYLTFADGIRFDALNPNNDFSFSAASPATFGFLGNAQSIEITSAPLNMPENQTFSLFSQQIRLADTTINAKNGRVRLQTAPINSEVSLTQTDFLTPPLLTSTDATAISIKNGSAIITEQNQSLQAQDTLIISTTGTLDIEDSTLDSSVQQNEIARAGNIFIKGGEVILKGAALNSTPRTIVETQGQGGHITLIANQLVLEDGSRQTILNSGNTMGRAGIIQLNARDTLRILGESSINVSTVESMFPAGQIIITASDLIMKGDGSLNALTSRGIGSHTERGKISITAEEIVLSGDTWIMGNTSNSGDRAGDVEINGQNLTLADQAAISSITLSDSQAGRINIRLTGVLSMSGDSAITADTLGTGDAGIIEIDVGWVELFDGAKITSNGESSNAYVQRVETQSDLLRQLGANFSEIAENRGRAGIVCVNASNQDCLSDNRLTALAIDPIQANITAVGCAELNPNQQSGFLTVRPVQNGLRHSAGMFMR